MINEREFSILSEMGVDLWQRKSVPTSPAIEPEKSLSQDVNINSEVDANTLIANQLFQDVLTCLNLTSGDVSINESEQGQYINLGFMNWCFSSDDSAVTFQDNLLTTPALQQLSQVGELKKSLWHIIIQHNL